MSYFKLDVSKTNLLIENYRKAKTKYVENLDSLYSSLANVESAWNDYNSKTFCKMISSDKIKIMDYLASLDLLYNQLSYFSDNLNSIAVRCGYTTKLKTIKFDDGQFSTCKTRLNRIINYINYAIYEINNYVLRSDFSNMTLIYNLRELLRGCIPIVNSIIDGFDKYVNEILKEIDERLQVVGKLEDIELDVNVIEYNPRVVNLTDYKI